MEIQNNRFELLTKCEKNKRNVSDTFQLNSHNATKISKQNNHVLKYAI